VCTLRASIGEGTNHEAAVGPTQSFTIAKVPGSVQINNMPATASFGGSFVPAFTKLGDGAASVTSLTTGTCTVTAGTVNFVGAGACNLQAAVAEGTNYLAATGALQSVNVTPIYTFIGFLAPVYNPTVVNKGKAGRTYPLKWQLKDSSGAFVSDLGAIKSITYTVVPTDTFSDNPVGAIVETTATGGTTLRYDSTANQFIYNWNTPSTPQSYVVFVTLKDGTVRTAYFNLTK